MMAAATRMHVAEKGKDPREYTLIAFGGAGPVHAFNLSRLLKVRRIVVPLGAGVASALGFLVAPPATDMVRSHVTRLDGIDWSIVNTHFAEMKAAGLGLLTEAGADPNSVSFRPSAEMRHTGQGFEISVDLPSVVLSGADLDVIRSNFFDNYRRQFGRVLEGNPIEAVNWRLSCTAPSLDIDISESRKRGEVSLAAAQRGTRKVLFEGDGWENCAVYDRYLLPPGCTFAGPALVEERESTCVIGSGAQARIDDFYNLVIEMG
jgi:N-methylhydantoinase A